MWRGRGVYLLSSWTLEMPVGHSCCPYGILALESCSCFSEGVMVPLGLLSYIPMSVSLAHLGLSDLLNLTRVCALHTQHRQPTYILRYFISFLSYVI